ncbi:MAG: MerR family DNA-binding transcriptional regulator [Sphingomonadaceae bacterium]|nr:MerR family DNA-binding transcriptional regulator [Sphingomonadaceae bacterium]
MASAARLALPYEAAPPDTAEHWSIAELAQAFAVTPRTIRFYEGEGLLTPTRAGQQRIYSKADRARLAWICRGRKLGFSLAEIREMLSLYDVGDGRQTQKRVTLAKCRERLEQLYAQRADLDATISELETFVATLEGRKAA